MMMVLLVQKQFFMQFVRERPGGLKSKSMTRGGMEKQKHGRSR